MIRLTQSQVRILIGLSQQRMEIQRAFNEVAESEQEYLRLLQSHYKLPEGEYQFLQQGNDIYITEVAQNASENVVNNPEIDQQDGNDLNNGGEDDNDA